MTHIIKLVKNITNLSEARYCAGMMVDYIVFNLNPNSEYYVSPEKLKEIKNWLSGVKLLGSYDGLSEDRISEVIVLNELSGFVFNEVQYPFADNVSCEHKFLETNDIKTEDQLKNFEFIIYDANKDEILSINNTKILDKILWAYDFENVEENINVAGFAFKGSKEDRPGFSNYDKLMDALEVLEELE